MYDLTDYLKSLESGTSSIDNSVATDTPKEPEITVITPLMQLKQGYAKMISKIKEMRIPVTESPIYVDEGVALKRLARYIDSSRLFGTYAIANTVFTPHLVMAWFKTLASGGDIEDALDLFDYLLSLDPPECYATDMLRKYVLVLQHAMDKGDVDMLVNILTAISGNPEYHITKSEIDIYQ